MGTINTTVTFRRFDEDLNLLEKRVQQSRSWTKHFFDLWYELAGWNLNTLANIADIGAANRTLNINSGYYPNLMVGSMPGGVGQPTQAGRLQNGADIVTMPTGDLVGIQIGSNVTAPTPGDNAMNTRILHGEVAGTMLFGGTEIYGLTFANPNGSMNIRRYFTNKSGGNVTVREVGIYSPGFNAGVTHYLFCICRDAVVPDVVVADTQILSVVYTVQITV